MIRARANRVGASLNSGEGSSGGLQVPRPARIPFVGWRTQRHLRPGTEAARSHTECICRATTHTLPIFPRRSSVSHEAETMPVAQGRCQLLRLVPLAGPWPAGTIPIRLDRCVRPVDVR